MAPIRTEGRISAAATAGSITPPTPSSNGSANRALDLLASIPVRFDYPTREAIRARLRAQEVHALNGSATLVRGHELPPPLPELPFHEAWKRTLPHLYPDNTFVDNLSRRLQQLGVKTLHDAACGLGFPPIPLHIALRQLEHDVTITCSDGSREMLDLFEKKQKRHNVKINHFESLWHELPEKLRSNGFPPKFDALFCIGYSLGQAKTLPAIAIALSSFRQVVKSGGIALFDLPGSDEYEHDYRKGPYLKSFGDPIKIDDEWVTLKWEITHKWHDEDQGVRTLKRLLTIDGRAVDPGQPSISCLLTSKKLIQLGRETGFNIERHRIPGEYYQTFLAQAA